MPIENNFQHDELSRKNPGDRLAYADWTTPPDVDSPAWQEAMGQAGHKLSQAGVRLIMFLHGSIPGTDVFGLGRLDEVGGLKRGYSRGISGLDSLLSFMREGTNGITPLPGGLKPPLSNDDATKNLLDAQIGDAGNFTTATIEQGRRALNEKLTKPIACVREIWSSEHHHLGRALAACRLLDRLHGLISDHHLGSDDRMLIQAHGQAGLVLALASNLLCPSPITGRKTLFELLLAAQPQAPDTQVIHRIEPLLTSGTLLNGVALDIVTFGTPVRYGWDPSGIGKLLHVVNHRNLRTDGKTWLSKMDMPQITVEMPIAWGGDYVQQLAAAGSDAVPAKDAAKAVNKSIWELVEPYDGFERWVECARRSGRVPSEGQCLLVDYKDCTSSTNVRDHYYGHAAYTRTNAMLFNFNQIVTRFYA
ncbi:MAG: hypothetical protein H0V35_16350 [Nitrospira sp.]|nr:hypothetical protein [Nitrospira sp.]MBA3754248.1 hypothetical protein [Nitrospira sp.]